MVWITAKTSYNRSPRSNNPKSERNLKQTCAVHVLHRWLGSTPPSAALTTEWQLVSAAPSERISPICCACISLPRSRHWFTVSIISFWFRSSSPCLIGTDATKPELSHAWPDVIARSFIPSRDVVVKLSRHLFWAQRCVICLRLLSVWLWKMPFYESDINLGLQL